MYTGGELASCTSQDAAAKASFIAGAGTARTAIEAFATIPGFAASADNGFKQQSRTQASTSIRGIGQSLPMPLMPIGQADVAEAGLISQAIPASAGAPASNPITSTATN
jgi:hypothetical protein